MSERFYLGIDVGTGRPAQTVFDARGGGGECGWEWVVHHCKHWQPQAGDFTTSPG